MEKQNCKLFKQIAALVPISLAHQDTLDYKIAEQRALAIPYHSPDFSVPITKGTGQKKINHDAFDNWQMYLKERQSYTNFINEVESIIKKARKSKLPHLYALFFEKITQYEEADYYNINVHNLSIMIDNELNSIVTNQDINNLYELLCEIDSKDVRYKKVIEKIEKANEMILA